MPLQIIHDDITKLAYDVIVNPTDNSYSGSGGTDYAVHKAAGADLDKYCADLPELFPGKVCKTPAFNLKAKHIYHTVGPVWENGRENEEIILRSCYLNCLILAVKDGVNSIAFPLISSGTFGFPKDKVLNIAITAISDFLFTNDSEIEVFICVYDKQSYELSRKIELDEFVNFIDIDEISAPLCDDRVMPCKRLCIEDDLEQWIKHQDDNFAVTLLKLINKKGMREVDVYKRANISKQTFSKIKNDANYRPSKQTVLAFAIALKLTLDETDQFLRTAGFSLSGSHTGDRIVEFYITRKIYDIFEINIALYDYDQKLLGCC